MKLFNMLYKVFCFSIFTLGVANASFAATPTVFFSDLTDGLVSGWEGSGTKGAAISIWGLNLGSTRGTSYVTVGGVNLTSDTDYAEWGVINIGNSEYDGYNSARGLQRTTFWLNSSMALGDTTITVTTEDGTSRTIPFHTRNTGNIYFLSPLGDDGNDGQTAATAWRNPDQARRTVVAGDTVYFKAGVYDKVDSSTTTTTVLALVNTNHANGTKNNSIAFTSYPGEFANFGTAANGSVIRHKGKTGDHMAYWTFSKFIFRASGNVTNWGLQIENGSDDNTRFIGNDCSTMLGGASIMKFSGQSGGQTNLYVLGNYIHDAGNDYRGDTIPSHSYGIYLQGFGIHKNVYIGYNEVSHILYGRAIQNYGHTVNDWCDNVNIYNNYLHHVSQNACVLSGGDKRDCTGDAAQGDCEYSFVRHLDFFNNVVVNNSPIDKWAALNIGGVASGSHGGTYRVLNNTFYMNGNGAFDLKGYPDSVTIQNNIIYNSKSFYADIPFKNDVVPIVGNNNYYGGANDIPNFEHDYLTEDPLFVDAANDDFRLQTNSPMKNAGLTHALTNVGYFGTSRPQDASFDIGASENYSTTTTSALNITLQSVNIQ